MASRAQIEAEVLRIVEDQPSDLTAAVVTHIQRAQRQIEERLDFRIQEEGIVFDVIPSSFTYAKPSDYLAAREAPFYLTDTSLATEATGVPVSRVFLKRWTDPLENLGDPRVPGRPKYWAESEELIQFFPPGDDAGPSTTTAGAYEVKFPYFKRLPTLTSAGSTNWWTENLDDVLAWRAASMLFSELRDPIAQFWSSVAAARYQEVVRATRRARFGQDNVQIFPKQSLSARTQAARAFGRRGLAPRSS